MTVATRAPRFSGRLRAATDGLDLAAGAFVRAIYGGPLGIIKELTPETAIVWWENEIGKYEVVDRRLLLLAAANPAHGLDVREW